MDRPSETVLDFPRDIRDLAREVRKWVATNHAERVGAVPCPECLWIRIEGPVAVGHLLFRLPRDIQESMSPSVGRHPLGSFRKPAYT